MSIAHTIIIRPVITEQTTLDRELRRQYHFEVADRATKPEIRKAVEELFNVKVDSVNVKNIKGKKRRVRYKEGYTKTVKKAIVTLKPDNTIKFFEGM